MAVDNPGVEALIAKRRFAIRSASSTLNLPNFAINQVKLYNACVELRKALVSKSEENYLRIANSVKNVFLKTISSAISVIKTVQILDFLRLIKLAKISRQLPDKLAKSSNLLSLGLTSLALIDSVWTLKKQIQRDRSAKLVLGEGLSSKAIKSIINVSSNGVKFISLSAATASLFFGVYSSAVAMAALSSISFAVSMFRNVFDQIYNGENGHHLENLSHLPA